MRLPNILKKIKDSPDLPKDIFILLLIFLVGIGVFLNAKYSAFENVRAQELRIVDRSQANNYVPEATPATLSAQKTEMAGVTPPSSGKYVGSRSGATYHLPWCSGAKRIREDNKIWFETKEDAESRGYRPAANCKGI